MTFIAGNLKLPLFRVESMFCTRLPSSCLKHRHTMCIVTYIYIPLPTYVPTYIRHLIVKMLGFQFQYRTYIKPPSTSHLPKAFLS